MTQSEAQSQREFKVALLEGVERMPFVLDQQQVAKLEHYFSLLQKWKTRMNLVGPCTPREFAERHVLESLEAVPHMRGAGNIVDVGSGAGLPGIPCLIALPDREVTLIESSTKKTLFLQEVAKELDLPCKVIAARFQQLPRTEAKYVLCRALERFSDVVSALITWSPADCKLILFGGNNLGDKLSQLNLRSDRQLLHGAERRFIFTVTKSGPERKS